MESNNLMMQEHHLEKSQTNFVQTACIELAMPRALSKRSCNSVSPSSDSKEIAFRTLRITGIATFTCSK